LLNETTASAFLAVCIAHASGAVARAALLELLSDEIDHARIGWAWLAAVDAPTRAEVGRWLLPMAYTNLRTWRSVNPPPYHVDVLERHGAPASSAIEDALVDALRSLVVPGLQELGIETGGIRAWLADGARTDEPPLDLL
jgi:hypothetical protein